MHAPSVGRAGSSTWTWARTLRTRPPREEPRDVDLVRHLVEQDAAAARGVELLGPARAIEEIGVVPGRDHAEPAKLAARDDVAHRAHRRIEGMGVADDQLHAGALDRRDDRIAFGERERHRLFEDDVLAVLRGEARVRGVELVRGRDVHDLDRRIGAQRCDVRIGAGVEIAREGRARRRMRIGRRAQDEPGMRRRGLHHHGAGHAEPGDAEPDRRPLLRIHP